MKSKILKNHSKKKKGRRANIQRGAELKPKKKLKKYLRRENVKVKKKKGGVADDGKNYHTRGVGTIESAGGRVKKFIKSGRTDIKCRVGRENEKKPLLKKTQQILEQ